MATSAPPRNKDRYTITALLFLSLFLFTILLFNKRALKPTLFLYKDLFFKSPLLSYSRTNFRPPFASGATHSVASTESAHSPADPPISPDFQSNSSRRINDELSVGDGNDPGQESVSFGPMDGNGSNLFLEGTKKCDLHMGTWVKDERYPIYKLGSCPYVDEAFDCQRNGRGDSDYLSWRWKPDGCDLLRFNATDFLLRLRGKRLMLVGESMNRNQFESILCLLREGLHDKSRMYEIHGHKITKGRGYFVFKFEVGTVRDVGDHFVKYVNIPSQDYNCTVEFVRSHFLVKEGLRINGQGNSNPTLSIDQIDKTANRWKRAGILVFNTGHWWTHGKTARGKNYYKEGDYLYPKFDAVEAYRRALRTWANWVDKNVNPKKQSVFDRGYSSAHFRGGDWDSGGSCKGETEPVLSGAILDNYPQKMNIVDEVLKEMQVPVKLLNVTRLTNFRKDGNPSMYGKNVTAVKKVSTRRQDCSHWFLPGVPDAWNELVYATASSVDEIQRLKSFLFL